MIDEVGAAPVSPSPGGDRPLVSVIIPFHNRWVALRQTLAALATQSLPPDRYEIIAVDDGSTEDAGDLAGELSGTTPSPPDVRLLRQQNRGAAAARNLGARHAAGDLLLFLDSDIVADPDLVQQHFEAHHNCRRVLVAGRRTSWPPACTSAVSQVLELNSNVEVEEGSPGLVEIAFDQALTNNLSVKRDDFQEIGHFDDAFPPGSGWEDIEFAYRAHKLGFGFVCNPRAVGYHNHPITLPHLCQKAREYQVSATLFFARHPELRGSVSYLRDKEPMRLGEDSLGLLARKLARRVLALPPLLSGMEAVTILLERHWPNPSVLEFLYWKILGSYQLMGFREGLRRYGGSCDGRPA